MPSLQHHESIPIGIPTHDDVKNLRPRKHTHHIIGLPGELFWKDPKAAIQATQTELFQGIRQMNSKRRTTDGMLGS